MIYMRMSINFMDLLDLIELIDLLVNKNEQLHIHNTLHYVGLTNDAVYEEE